MVSLKRTGQSRSALRACYRCGGQHLREDCRFKEAHCHNCRRKGHIAKVCKSKSTTQQARYVSDTQENSEEIDLYAIAEVHVDSSGDGIEIFLELAGHHVKMILDMGASLFIIPESFYNRFLRNWPLHVLGLRLQSCTEEVIPIMRETTLSVTCGQQACSLPVVVVKCGRPALLGRNWHQHLRLN